MKSHLTRFKNKVVLVTGSSKGIGKATAIQFAKEGAKLIINYFSSEKEANKVVDEIKEIGSEAVVIKCDVSQEIEVVNLMKQVIKIYGKIDILVNNAGIVYDIPVLDRKIEFWNRTLEVNLRGNFLCSKYAAVEMLKNSCGKIINIASTSAIHTFSPDSIDYDASKAGVITLTKDFAKALAPYIQVNAVAPGWVNTNINKNLPKDLIDEETKKIYCKRFAQPEEIAAAVLFLASPEASYINGTVLVVDGGHD